jgi:hypothetical protein
MRFSAARLRAWSLSRTALAPSRGFRRRRVEGRDEFEEMGLAFEEVREEIGVVRGQGAELVEEGLLGALAAWFSSFRSENFLSLTSLVRSISCVFSKGWGLVFNIFLAHVSQLYHIGREDIWRFRRPAPKKINHDGS